MASIARVDLDGKPIKPMILVEPSLCAAVAIDFATLSPCRLHGNNIQTLSSLFTMASTCDGSTEAAELLKVCWLEVRGKLKTTELSPGIRYEVVFVVKLQAKAYGWDVPVNLKLTVPHASENRWSKVNLTDKAREKWIEIPVGDFIASPKKPGDVEFSLYEYDGRWKSGLVIKGVVVRPKY
ncbi:PREDICTED: PHLOEM PROTEIN 2-LIKE [Prunus dulcis]|uniref:PREDICTED: PHLOEM PROTEIN 2-LIKE n=2 Tax=Prunus dulcis TaxID=3755 RepID=A0A5E4FW19_PRUDU|nr:PREDICTED: PHLOEM PROTEIN 2-LIKE [Prunus dulcis]